MSLRRIMIGLNFLKRRPPSLERDQTDVALKLTNAFLFQVRALTTSGVLDEARTNSLLRMVEEQTVAYLE